MSPFAITLVITAAVTHASWNILARRTDEPYAYFFALNLLAVVVWFPVVLVAGWSERLSGGDILLMTGSGLLQVLYFICLAAAYRRAGVGIVYPTARGTGVAVVPIAGFVLFGERPTTLGWIGIVAIFIGLTILGLTAWTSFEGVDLSDTRGAVLFAFLTGLVISSYSLFDNYGVERVDPVVYGYGLIVAAVVIQVPYVLARRRDVVKMQLVSNRKAAVAGAILVLGTYMLILIALSESNVGYVVPLRETSIVFALILGIFVLHEPLSPRRLIAAVIVACGAIAIAIGG